MLIRLSHGKATIEMEFNINGKPLVENLHMEILIA